MTVSQSQKTARTSGIYRRRFRQNSRLQEDIGGQCETSVNNLYLLIQPLTDHHSQLRTYANTGMAGAPGFEPENGGIKILRAPDPPQPCSPQRVRGKAPLREGTNWLRLCRERSHRVRQFNVTIERST